MVGSQIHYKPIYKQNLFKNEIKFETHGAEEYYKIVQVFHFIPV